MTITLLLLLLQDIDHWSNSVKHLWCFDESVATLRTWLGVYCLWLFSSTSS